MIYHFGIRQPSLVSAICSQPLPFRGGDERWMCPSIGGSSFMATKTRQIRPQACEDESTGHRAQDTRGDAVQLGCGLHLPTSMYG